MLFRGITSGHRENRSIIVRQYLYPSPAKAYNVEVFGVEAPCRPREYFCVLLNTLSDLKLLARDTLSDPRINVMGDQKYLLGTCNLRKTSLRKVEDRQLLEFLFEIRLHQILDHSHYRKVNWG